MRSGQGRSGQNQVKVKSSQGELSSGQFRSGHGQLNVRSKSCKVMPSQVSSGQLRSEQSKDKSVS